MGEDEDGRTSSVFSITRWEHELPTNPSEYVVSVGAAVRWSSSFSLFRRRTNRLGTLKHELQRWAGLKTYEEGSGVRRFVPLLGGVRGEFGGPVHPKNVKKERKRKLLPNQCG